MRAVSSNDPTAVNRPWLARRLRQTRDWVLGFHGTPKQVALGLAVGVFVAFTPSLGMQMIVAAVLATVLYANRAAAVAAVWITNPLTVLPVYVLTYRVGCYMTPGTNPINIRRRLLSVLVDEEGEWLYAAEQVRELFSLGTDVLVPLTVGGLVVGLAAGALAYVLTRLTLAWARKHLHLPHRRHENPRGRLRPQSKSPRGAKDGRGQGGTR